MDKEDYSQQTMIKENGIEFSPKEDRVKEKVVYKVVPVPYYYPVPVDAEWYYKHYEPPMRNGSERGYHGYDDPTFDHFPFPPPPIHGFPAPPRSRDFHYHPAGSRDDIDRYCRPVSPLFRHRSSPGRGEFSPPAPESSSKKQPKEKGDHKRSMENGEKASDKNNNKDDISSSENVTANTDNKEKEDQASSGSDEEDSTYGNEGNEGELLDDVHSEENNNSKNRENGGGEHSPKSNNSVNGESESNRKRKRYMMTFPYDQRKKTEDVIGGEYMDKEERLSNSNIESIGDLSPQEHTPENRRMHYSGEGKGERDERERVYLKQKSYPSNGGVPNGHYPPYIVMRSPPYMGGETGRSARYSHERSHSMYEPSSRRYEDVFKDRDTTAIVRMSECDDDKKEIRYHPNGRRARTVFTRQQLLTLNNVFDKHPFVSGERMSELSDQLGLDRKIVKIWFQNKRQYARKKGSLVERNEEYYYDYQDRFNPSSAPPSMAAEHF